MPLTDFQLKQAAPCEREWKLAERWRSFIPVRPSGSKFWRMKFRQFGKEKKLSFGR